MIVRIFIILLGVITLSACNSDNPEIQALCFRDDIGNYMLKWETNPLIKGIMKLYVSDDPEIIVRSNPVGYTDIEEGVTKYVTQDNITRKYFELSFNDKYFKKVASRSVVMDSVQNLRDLGGYPSSKNNKSTRWGKVFRSGELTALSDRDTIRLDNLKIKTIIDLRTEQEVAASPIVYKKARIEHIPISTGNFSNIMERIYEGRVRKGDGVLFMQDLYLQYVTENSGQLAKAMEIFSDEENYPLLLNCNLGKDRAGFLSALFLYVLNIPEEIIMNDYLATNDYFDLKRYAPLVEGLGADAQETLTVILTANSSYLELAFGKIKKDYGSIEKYLKEELNITEKEQSRIKDIMLF